MGKVIRSGVSYTTEAREGIRQFVDYDTFIYYNAETMEKIGALKAEIDLLRKEFEEYKNQQNNNIIKDEGYYYPFGEV